MGKINVGRVIGGGLVAGLVINLIEGIMNGAVLANQWADQMHSLNRPPGGTVQEIVMLNLWGFAGGIVTLLLYAMIRPRMGAGPKTALCAGLFTWVTISVMGVSIPWIFGIYRPELALAAMGIELVEMPLAALAGAYFYKE
jgi:hypothetical protein